MTDPEHFDARAETYAASRPPYPDALWDVVRATGAVGPGRRVVDLGAGSGEATGPLLAAGCVVVAVEPGPRLAARLRDRCPTARVVVARAEDAELGTDRFDLAVAATSIHWMDLDVLMPRLHRALAPKGRFLVWRTVFGDDTVDPTPFRRRVEQIVRRRDRPPRTGDPEDVGATARRLEESGLFAVDDVRTFRWSVELDDRQVHRLFDTFSDWTAGEVDAAAAAVRALGGSVVEHYGSWLIRASPR